MPDIPASIIESGIADVPLNSVVEVALQRVLDAGVPLDRMNVGFRILHPLFDGMSITWTRESGAEVSYAALVDKEGSDFRVSPFYMMLTGGNTEWRLRLDRDAAVERFPLLTQLKEKGFTDYLALIVAFGGAPLHLRSYDGLATSWSTRSPQGFSDDDVAIMRGVLAPLALVFRLAIKDQITKNALNTFHGPMVGGRILSGTIKRGDGERLDAALWYSDLSELDGSCRRAPGRCLSRAAQQLFRLRRRRGDGAGRPGARHHRRRHPRLFSTRTATMRARPAALALEAAVGARGRLADAEARGKRLGAATLNSASACISAMWCSAMPARPNGSNSACSAAR